MKSFKIEKVGAIENLFKGMFILAKGTVLARVIGLVSMPVLTRIYSPDDYGMLALYISLVMLLAPLLTLRYVQAIPLPKTDAMAINLFVVCLNLILLSLIIIALAMSVFGAAILAFFDMHTLAPFWPLIVLGVAGTALYELFSLWATRKKRYRVLGKAQVVQSLWGNFAKIALGLLAVKPAGLLLGQFIAQSGGIGSFIRSSSGDLNRLKLKLSKRRCFFLAKYYKDFPCYRLPSQILMTASLQAPVLMMAALFNRELTGQLSLAMMALSMPGSLIGAVIAKAYYAEIASLGKNNVKEIKKLTFGVQKRLFSIGLPITVAAILSAEVLFVLVFGEKWRPAGEYAALLAPFVLFQFTSAPLMEVINVVGSQLSFLILHLLRALGLAGLFFLSKLYLLPPEKFVLVLSFSLSLFYFSASLFVFYVLKRSG